MHERLFETITKGRPRPFYITCRDKRFNYKKVIWTNIKIDCRSGNNVKKWPRNVSVSNIIVFTDNTKLNEKGCEVNFHLKKKYKEWNLYLINHSKNIKPSHLNRGKLHLNQKGSKVLGDVFLKQISTVFNWRCVGKISSSINEEYKSNFSLEDNKRIDSISILKLIPTDNSNKLVFAHLNINSIRNKSELLSDQIKGNIDVLIISEPRIDDSFLETF